MKTLFRSFLLLALFLSNQTYAEPKKTKAKTDVIKMVADNKVPFERPIGFTYNVGALSSFTFEGRFFVGLAPHISLIVSPAFQRTIELPIYHFRDGVWSAFHIKRLNLGLGIRGHFYEYDSYDGFFIEALVRPGLTWVAKDPSMWSMAPSLLFGYAVVYESGYTVSYAIGLEPEWLLGTPPGKSSKFLQSAAFGITKFPIAGEISLGWTW